MEKNKFVFRRQKQRGKKQCPKRDGVPTQDDRDSFGRADKKYVYISHDSSFMPLFFSYVKGQASQGVLSFSVVKKFFCWWIDSVGWRLPISSASSS